MDELHEGGAYDFHATLLDFPSGDFFSAPQLAAFVSLKTSLSILFALNLCDDGALLDSEPLLQVLAPDNTLFCCCEEGLL